MARTDNSQPPICDRCCRVNCDHLASASVTSTSWPLCSLRALLLLQRLSLGLLFSLPLQRPYRPAYQLFSFYLRTLDPNSSRIRVSFRYEQSVHSLKQPYHPTKQETNLDLRAFATDDCSHPRPGSLTLNASRVKERAFRLQSCLLFQHHDFNFSEINRMTFGLQ
jgi:hypothetical protein